MDPIHVAANLTSYLPHRKATVPYRDCPKSQLRVYLDTELALPLGFNEPEIRNLFTSIGRGYNRLLDIGGHIGTYSILFEGLTGGTVVVVEPHPNNFRRIRENLRLNNIESKISTIQAALSNEDGTGVLSVDDNPTKHKLGGSNGLTIQTQRVDSLLNDRKNPDLVKVDVEGVAGDVVRGATNTISQHAADWIVEYHNSEEYKATHEMFEKHGYSIRTFGEYDKLFAVSNSND